MRMRCTIGLVGSMLAAGSYLQVGQAHTAGPQAAQPEVVPESQRAASRGTADASPDRALLNRYCVTCHNERLKSGGLMLDRMDVGQVSVDANTWEKVVRKLRSGQMPPEGRPRPDPQTIRAFATAIEAALDRVAAAHPDPGRVAVRRLNRTEYVNVDRRFAGAGDRWAGAASAR